MKKHYYYYRSNTSIQLTVWFWNLSLGFWIIWSNGLFVIFNANKQMTKEEYEEATA